VVYHGEIPSAALKTAELQDDNVMMSAGDVFDLVEEGGVRRTPSAR